MFLWLASVLRSFGPAVAGLLWALKTQRNLKVHVIAAVLVVILGLWLKISAWEWCVVFLAAGMVLMAELLNTSLEVLADRVTQEREESIRRVKDAAAGAVFVAALAAFCAGILIFLPKLWLLL